MNMNIFFGTLHFLKSLQIARVESFMNLGQIDFFIKMNKLRQIFCIMKKYLISIIQSFFEC